MHKKRWCQFAGGWQNKFSFEYHCVNMHVKGREKEIQNWFLTSKEWERRDQFNFYSPFDFSVNKLWMEDSTWSVHQILHLLYFLNKHNLRSSSPLASQALFVLLCFNNVYHLFMQSCNLDNNVITIRNKECDLLFLHKNWFWNIFWWRALEPDMSIIMKPGWINWYKQKHHNDKRETSSLPSALSQRQFWICHKSFWCLKLPDKIMLFGSSFEFKMVPSNLS